MSLSIKTSGDLIAVGRMAQSNETTAAALDSLLLFDETSSLDITETREDNQAEKTGHVEATDVEVLDAAVEGATLTMPKAAPDGLAFGSGFFCGNSTESTIGGTIRRHIARVNAYPENPKYFTAAHRRGGSGGAPADMRRLVGLGINTLGLNLAKGEFMTMALGVIGLGRFNDAILTEEFSINWGVTQQVVLAHEVEDTGGASTNITAWADFDDDGIFEYPLAISSYTPGTDTLVFVDPTKTGTHAVRVTYPVKATETAYFGSPSWRTAMEALVTADEFKLKAANIQILLNADISDSPPAIAAGTGQIALCEVESLEYLGDWQGNPGRCWRTGAAGTDVAHATQVELGDMRQTITVNRRVRDYLFKQNFDKNAPMSVYFDAYGPEIDAVGFPGERFHFKAFFPRVKFLERPYQVSEGRWVEAGTLLVLKDTVGLLPTAIFQSQNEVANYIS